MNTSITQYRDRALRSIGRNVVNFQRLEQCIKFVSQFAHIEGSLAKTQRDQRRRHEQISKNTLGQAVAEIQRMMADDNRPLPSTSDMFDPWVITSFEFIDDKSIAKQHCEELAYLVGERNDLIHHRLAKVDFDSPEQCAQLSRELDDQNRKILKLLGVFGPLVTELRQLLVGHYEYVSSAEFLAWLQSVCKDGH